MTATTPAPVLIAGAAAQALVREALEYRREDYASMATLAQAIGATEAALAHRATVERITAVAELFVTHDTTQE